MNKQTAKEQAERIWINCIHRNITGFTLSQEKKAIEDIEKELNRFLSVQKERIRELELLIEIEEREYTVALRHLDKQLSVQKEQYEAKLKKIREMIDEKSTASTPEKEMLLRSYQDYLLKEFEELVRK